MHCIKVWWKCEQTIVTKYRRSWSVHSRRSWSVTVDSTLWPGWVSELSRYTYGSEWMNTTRMNICIGIINVYSKPTISFLVLTKYFFPIFPLAVFKYLQYRRRGCAWFARGGETVYHCTRKATNKQRFMHDPFSPATTFVFTPLRLPCLNVVFQWAKGRTKENSSYRSSCRIKADATLTISWKYADPWIFWSVFVSAAFLTWNLFSVVYGTQLITESIVCCLTSSCDSHLNSHGRLDSLMYSTT